jgi:hypothetical protein
MFFPIFFLWWLKKQFLALLFCYCSFLTYSIHVTLSLIQIFSLAFGKILSAPLMDSTAFGILTIIVCNRMPFFFLDHSKHRKLMIPFEKLIRSLKCIKFKWIQVAKFLSGWYFIDILWELDIFTRSFLTNGRLT